MSFSYHCRICPTLIQNELKSIPCCTTERNGPGGICTHDLREVSGGASAGNNMQAVKEKTVGCHVRKENGRNKLGLCVLEKKLGPVPKAYAYFMGMYSQFLTILK